MQNSPYLTVIIINKIYSYAKSEMGKMLEQGCSILETNFENVKYQIVCELPQKLALIRVFRDEKERERERKSNSII